MNTRPKIGRVEAQTKTKLFVDANPKRRCLKAQNLGTANVELLSSKDARYGDGWRISHVQTEISSLYVNRESCQGAFWIVAEEGTQDVRFEEDIEV